MRRQKSQKTTRLAYATKRHCRPRTPKMYLELEEIQGEIDPQIGIKASCKIT
jgi:hypothetical protein